MSGGSFSLELVGAAGGVEPASVFVSGLTTTKGGITVTLRWAGGELAAVARDAFTAFSEVRECLAGLGLVPRCYGACRNLVLSSMAYQMSRGLKGYLVRLGVPARQSDLVRIFDAGPVMDLATVAEQQEFKRAWLRSLGFRAEPGAGPDRPRG